MSQSEKNSQVMEKIVSLCKRRGFIFQGSEIYGGLAGTWDYGHLGAELLDNIKQSWWKKFVDDREDMYGIRAAILMSEKVWQATGHVANFTDPMDGGKFNTMFQTKIGAQKDEIATAYLRPETAQGIFVNFKNTVDAYHPKLPFGIAQIGKAFRNEIAPRDFTFRSREFEQMEIEYFIREAEWKNQFEFWKNEMSDWMQSVGIDTDRIHELEVAGDDLAHYSKRTIDFEFDFPFGRKELFGLAYRTDFDLKAHGLENSYLDEESNEKITPHVIEPSFGADRAFLAVLLSAYQEDELGDEPRVVLKFKPSIAPVVCAVSPLLKNKPELQTKAREVFKLLKQEFGNVMYDDNGNIGKRYRRQDEIGTPWCVVIDFETLGNEAGKEDLADTVTIRDRDTGNQERIPIADLVKYIKERI